MLRFLTTSGILRQQNRPVRRYHSAFLKTILWIVFSQFIATSPWASDPACRDWSALEKQYGSLLLKPEQAPALYQFLENHFQPLAKAQHELSGGKLQACLVIINSPEVNAYSKTEPKAANAAKNAVRFNQVLLYRGLLDKIADANQLDKSRIETSGAAQAFVRDIVGAIGHELAHPLEWVERENLGTHSEVIESLTQSSEFFADTRAQDITELAGYGRDPIYHVGTKLRWDEASAPAQSVAVAMIDTHPIHQGRRALTRATLTATRHEKGFAPDAALQAVQKFPAAAWNELNQLDPYQAQKPKDFHELLARLKEVENFEPEHWRSVEFTLLNRSLNQMIMQRPLPGDRKDRNALYEAILKVGKTRIEPLSNQELKTALSRKPESLWIQDLPTQETALKTSAVFKSGEYRSWLKRNYFEGENPEALNRHWNRLLRILPPEEIMTDFHDEMKRNLARIVDMDNSAVTILERNMLNRKNDKEFRSLLKEEELYNRLTHPAKNVARIQSFFPVSIQAKIRKMAIEQALDPASGGYYSPELRALVLFLNAGEEAGPKGAFQDFLPIMDKTTGSRLSKDQLIARKSPELQAAIKEQLSFVWKNRGYFGYLDLLMVHEHIDWPAIWHEAGVSPEQGRRELIRAVKEFAKTPRYSEIQNVLNTTDSLLNRSQMTIAQALMGRSNGTTLPSWADPTLFEAFEIEELHRLTKDPRISLKAYQKRLAKEIDSMQSASPEERISPRDFRAALSREFGTTGLEHHELTIARLIDRLRIPAKEKKPYFEYFFLNTDEKNSIQERISSVVKRDIQDLPLIEEILRKNGVSTSTLDRTAHWLEASFKGKRAHLSAEHHFLHIDEYADILLKDLPRDLSRFSDLNQKKERYLKLARLLFDPNEGPYRDGPFNFLKFKQLKSEFVKMAPEMKLSNSEQLALFKYVTASGPTPETDQLISDRMSAVLKKPGQPDDFIVNAVKEKRIESEKTRLEVVKALIEKNHAKHLGDRAEFEKKMIQWVDEILPSASRPRDKLLEELAWKYHFRGDSLLKLIESRKTTSPLHLNTKLVNLTSGIGSTIESMNQKTRLDLLRYLVDDTVIDIPKSVSDTIELTVSKELDHKELSYVDIEPRKKASAIEEAISDAKKNLESFKRDATHFEKVPAVDFILNAGADPISKASGYPDQIVAQFLKYRKGSNEELSLKAFLKVIPEEERTVSMAYLLSQPKGESSTPLLDVFGVFKTPGHKAAQQASLWQLFGPDVSRELAKAKDNTPPLSLAEIESILKRDLTPEEFGKIASFDRILGSASIKTVAEVTLSSGKKAALLIQRPHAAEQVRTNLKIAADFLYELRNSGLKLPGGIFKTLLADLGSQMDSELDMRVEAEKIQNTKKIYEKMNQRHKELLHGYRFEVPQTLSDISVRKNIMLMEVAPGIPWTKADKDLTAPLGEALVTASEDALFRDGWFEGDPHRGNLFVDPKEKIISMIDRAQSTAFSKTGHMSEDERYLFAELMRAISNQDAKNTANFAEKMGKLGPGYSRESLLREISNAFQRTKNAEPSSLWIEAINAILEADIHLDPKYTVVGFKGQLTLAAEHYVPPAKFKQIAKKAIRRLLAVEKLPTTLVNRFPQKSRCFETLKKLLDGFSKNF